MRRDVKPVKSKTDFASRYMQHEFGNHTCTWGSFKEWACSSTRHYCNHKLYHLRNRIKGGKTYYNVPGYTLYTWASADWVYKPNWYVSEMSPHNDFLLIQGEISRGDVGIIRNHSELVLTWTQVRKPMRDALAELTLTSRGLLAKELLRYYMDHQSYEWLNYLLDTYVDHVIEFSTFSKPCGIYNWNTLFWEVRQY